MSNTEVLEPVCVFADQPGSGSCGKPAVREVWVSHPDLPEPAKLSLCAAHGDQVAGEEGMAKAYSIVGLTAPEAAPVPLQHLHPDLGPRQPVVPGEIHDGKDDMVFADPIKLQQQAAKDAGLPWPPQEAHPQPPQYQAPPDQPVDPPVEEKPKSSRKKS